MDICLAFIIIKELQTFFCHDHQISRRQIGFPRSKGFPDNTFDTVALDCSGNIFLGHNNAQARGFELGPEPKYQEIFIGNPEISFAKDAFEG